VNCTETTYNFRIPRALCAVVVGGFCENIHELLEKSLDYHCADLWFALRFLIHFGPSKNELSQISSSVVLTSNIYYLLIVSWTNSLRWSACVSRRQGDLLFPVSVLLNSGTGGQIIYANDFRSALCFVRHAW
jgi:hypothetical protein